MSREKIHVLSRAVVIDQDHILLCQTQDLENNFYFLPGGHVEHEESVQTTLIRELEEEAGYQCKIDTLLGCLEHTFKPGHNSICHNHEYNFIFKVSGEGLTFGCPLPQKEPHIKLFWISLQDLPHVDMRPAPMRECLKDWLSGGTFFKSDLRA
ncbi:MAG: hypothetical protein CNLJKLNK_00572 [Holosporales bacterium]